MSFIAHNLQRQRVRLSASVVAACMLAASATAQTEQTPATKAAKSAESKLQVDAAASDDALWLVVVEDKISTLFHREPLGEFDLGRTGNQPIAAITTMGSDALVVYADGSVQRYGRELNDERIERTLPKRARPIAMAGADRAVYALVSASVGESLEWDLPSTAAATQPFDRDAPSRATTRFNDETITIERPTCVTRYDGRDWRAIAVCPPGARSHDTGRMGPKIGLERANSLLIAWADNDRVTIARRLTDENAWRTVGELPARGLVGYWLVNLSGTPGIVLATAEDESAEEVVQVFRLLGRFEPGDEHDWRPGNLELSDAPAGVGTLRYEHAFGFNQHLGLLAVDAAGHSFVRFGRIDAKPTETTIDVRQVYAEPMHVQQTQYFFQFITFVVLLFVLIGLFVFRRGSMINPVIIPPGLTIATHAQRAVGWLIDFLPFVVAAALILDVSMSEGFATVFAWGVSSTPSDQPPDMRLLGWWALGCAGHTLYALVMELLTGRTIGKVLTRTYVVSENGRRPLLWQVLSRNACRVLELMPQFWLFALLVLFFSRNQQRLGDVFGRTYLARRAPIFIAIDSEDSEPKLSGDKNAQDGADDADGSTGADESKDNDANDNKQP